jgi:hypothetical protein
MLFAMKRAFAMIFVAAALPASAQAPKTAAQMTCAEYAKADGNSRFGALGGVKTGDSEADAMMAQIGEKVRGICGKAPTMNLQQAMQKAIEEISTEDDD